MKKPTARPTKAKGTPSKAFFISMITRDISLQACILDLLDNCLDGARNHQIRLRDAKRTRQEVEATTPDEVDKSWEPDFNGYKASIEFDKESFSIVDNCGGITLSDAVDHAFNFGRREGAPDSGEYGIGLYGIGMKRAMFKIGREIEILSSTEREGEAFRVPIEVDAWKNQGDGDWDFDLLPLDEFDGLGTTLTVSQLNPGIGEEFADRIFSDKLTEVIARDYSFLVQKGFEIRIDRRKVDPYSYGLRRSTDFEPIHTSYQEENNVIVEVSAGLTNLPSEDDSPQGLSLDEVDYYGWFVICNERVVLAANKDDTTVWGVDDIPKYHPQFNGFMGILHFKAEDPNALPWTTTKRDIEKSNPIYRRALRQMRDATRDFIDYTNVRKSNTAKAREKERATTRIPILQLQERAQMKVPKLTKVETITIQYPKPASEIRKAKMALGYSRMSARQVGIKTFNYFYKREVESEE